MVIIVVVIVVIVGVVVVVVVIGIVVGVGLVVFVVSVRAVLRAVVDRRRKQCWAAAVLQGSGVVHQITGTLVKYMCPPPPLQKGPRKQIFIFKKQLNNGGWCVGSRSHMGIRLHINCMAFPTAVPNDRVCRSHLHPSHQGVPVCAVFRN